MHAYNIVQPWGISAIYWVRYYFFYSNRIELFNCFIEKYSIVCLIYLSVFNVYLFFSELWFFFYGNNLHRDNRIAYWADAESSLKNKNHKISLN